MQMALDGHPSHPDDGGDPLIGQTIANCRVLARIGQGGMGTVYVARHTILGRCAAIKVLLPEYSNNRELVGRFLNEARATAQLRHGGFVEIFDSGALRDGSAYLVMEYLRGANLAAAIEWRTAIAVRETLAVLGDVAASVSYAHKHGIVHRDLKPDNIFLAVEGDHASGRDRVTIKVLDFGIAKLTGAAGTRAAAGAPSRTRTGSILGTPLYMSPEQCRGAGQVDYRTDIYSLGCIAYHALSGRPPFALEGFGEIIAAHLDSAPVPLREHLPSLPDRVEAFVHSLLAKEPGARPQTMDAVTTALVQLRGGERVADADMLALIPPAALLKGEPPADLEVKSGETRLLPVSTRPAPASISTLAGAASELGQRRLGKRAGPVIRMTIGVLFGVGLTVGLLLTFGPAHHTARTRYSEDLVRTSFPKIHEGETPASPSDETPSGAQQAAAPEEARPRPAFSSGGTNRSLAGPTVTVRIASAPMGASVVDEKTGRVSGQTPLEMSAPRANGHLGVVLRKRGYRPKRITIDLAGNTDVNVTLDKRSAAGVSTPDDSDEDLRKL